MDVKKVSLDIYSSLQIMPLSSESDSLSSEFVASTAGFIYLPATQTHTH